MNIYSIINNENKLKEFIDWLPDLKTDETYYVCLFSRTKYCNKLGLQSINSQIKRFTSKKEYLFNEIQQLEIPIGRYQKHNIVIPQESLALYINPNPRSFEKAAKKSLIRLANLITEPYSGYNTHKEILSQIQISYNEKVFMDFDFDNVEFNKDNFTFINNDCLHIVKTIGGFHALVELNKIDEKYKKSWYNKMIKIDGVDVRGDNLLPVPGCCQGCFTPYIIDK